MTIIFKLINKSHQVVRETRGRQERWGVCGTAQNLKEGYAILVSHTLFLSLSFSSCTLILVCFSFVHILFSHQCSFYSLANRQFLSDLPTSLSFLYHFSCLCISIVSSFSHDLIFLILPVFFLDPHSFISFVFCHLICSSFSCCMFSRLPLFH